MAQVEKPELVTIAEIAEMFGVSIPAVKNWQAREYLNFPEPYVKGPSSHDTPYWRKIAVKLWAVEHRPNLV
jgi:hypothetical protein